MGQASDDRDLELERDSWPAARLGEALEAVVRLAGVPSVRSGEMPPVPDPTRRQQALGLWIEAAATHLGLEAERAEASHAELQRMVLGAPPALIEIVGDGASSGAPPRFVALVRRRGSRVLIVGPHDRRRWVRASALAALLGRPLRQPLLPEVDRLLQSAGVPPRQLARARNVIIDERLAQSRVGGCWLLRLPPGGSFWQQVRLARLPRQLLTFVGGHLAAYLLLILAWWLIGLAALSGHFDRQWLYAWVLLLLTQVPFGVLVNWSQGRFAIGLGALLKLRLLQGALRLDPEQIRREGAGQLLGRVVESETVESLAVSAGFSSVVAVIELVAAAVVLTLGPGGVLRLLLLIAWVGVACWLGWRYYRRRLEWTENRLEMTNDLVERMVGQRTRIAQQQPGQWHEGEDQLLSRYVELSADLDRHSVRLGTLLSRGWLVLGLFGLIPVVIPAGVAPVAVGIALGGLLMASRASRTLAMSLDAMVAAAVAWQQVRPLFAAAGDQPPIGAPDGALLLERACAAGSEGDKVLEGQQLRFAYASRGDQPAIDGCSLVLRQGDRLLLEGPSGGGKTTLAALLVGLREPDAGLLLLRGLDRQTVGLQSWRHRVVASPQFHDNHVMTGTFAFNVLMGYRWPPEPGDMERADAVCRQLGMGPLLDRMPGGMLQVVGETGWRLSHGEQSLLFVARTIMQQADVMVFDESFGALDPKTLRRALECVLDQSSTLLVIAHP